MKQTVWQKAKVEGLHEGRSASPGVYLGGPSRELLRVRRYANALSAQGVRLVSRWFDGAEVWQGRDARLDDAEQLRRAECNQRAMRAARIVWILWPLELSEGAVGELGYALAHRWHVGSGRAHVIVSGQRVRSSILSASADVRLRSDEVALSVCLSVLGLKKVALRRYEDASGLRLGGVAP